MQEGSRHNYGHLIAELGLESYLQVLFTTIIDELLEHREVKAALLEKIVR